MTHTYIPYTQHPLRFNKIAFDLIAGCDLLFFPAAFHEATGPTH